MKTIIHVNQHIIKKNRKEGTTQPVLTCKTYKSNDYASTVIILDKEGKEAGRFIYSAEPLACGAQVWFETANNIKIIN